MNLILKNIMSSNRCSFKNSKFFVTVHSRVNHYADWHGGCTFYLEWHLAHRQRRFKMARCVAGHRYCLAMGRRVEGLAFWCIRIGFDWMLDKTEPEFVTIHRASRTVDEDSLSRVIIRLPGKSIRCHKFRFRFVLQPSSR